MTEENTKARTTMTQILTNLLNMVQDEAEEMIALTHRTRAKLEREVLRTKRELNEWHMPNAVRNAVDDVLRRNPHLYGAALAEAIGADYGALLQSHWVIQGWKEGDLKTAEAELNAFNKAYRGF